ncbi:MAG: hypothetical protein NC112_02920 [Oxalobacter formigenes]|nr:hypothetical protein [Oxalobacter formigenes]
MEQRQSVPNKLYEKKEMKGDKTPSCETLAEQRLDEAKAVHNQIYGNQAKEGGISQTKAS